MAVLLLLVALCAAQGLYWIAILIVRPFWGALLMAAFWSALGTGLWMLHPIARGVAVFLLWLLMFVLIVGVINPFSAGDILAQGGTPPPAWQLALWVAPPVAVVVAILHILGKYKPHFGRKLE